MPFNKKGIAFYKKGIALDPFIKDPQGFGLTPKGLRGLRGYPPFIKD